MKHPTFQGLRAEVIQFLNNGTSGIFGFLSTNNHTAHQVIYKFNTYSLIIDNKDHFELI